MAGVKTTMLSGIAVGAELAEMSAFVDDAARIGCGAYSECFGGGAGEVICPSCVSSFLLLSRWLFLVLIFVSWKGWLVSFLSVTK